MKLTVGTRGSDLARTQSGTIVAALEELGHEAELVVIRSEGDVTAGSLVDAGGLGLFAATLRRALLAGTVDLVVHSLKDLPTAPVPGLVLAALPEREPSCDVLCARDGLRLTDLPAGARVGTGSPRRAAQVRARRPDLTVVEIRGNVNTRLARVHGGGITAGDLDAVVLARAGLARLDRLDAVTDTLDLLPAPGQGALAVECRAEDRTVREILSALDHAETRLCVTAERAVLAELGAGCAAPVAAHARVSDGQIELTASVFDADGTREVTVRRREPLPLNALGLGREVAAELLTAGAAEVTRLAATRESRIQEFHHEQALWAPGTEPALVGRRVLLPRADGPLAQAIRAAGASVDAVRVTECRPLPFSLGADRPDWLVLTSPTAVRVLVDSGYDPAALAARIAAVGPATASAIESAGGTVSVLPEGRSDAGTLLAALPQEPASALVPCSALASPRLADGLRDRGWRVQVVHTYTMVTRDRPSGLHAWPEYDAVVLTAGSVARAVVDLLGPPPDCVAVVALGRPSARAAAELSLRVDAVAATQDAPGVIAALSAACQELR